MVDYSFKTLRESKGVTQTELSNLLGVTRMTVWRWDVGKVKPGAEYHPKLRTLGLYEGELPSDETHEGWEPEHVKWEIFNLKHERDTFKALYLREKEKFEAFKKIMGVL